MGNVATDTPSICTARKDQRKKGFSGSFLRQVQRYQNLFHRIQVRQSIRTPTLVVLWRSDWIAEVRRHDCVLQKT